ncbi:PfkB family carbohydrate kinase [Aureimonas sp. AU12]|uniref:PfkB family carbohydrate kinase n=1 Tax=Aureimonas sp. AU12 TaxID=1638161 RepID=UPI000784782F|nr:PfkB family carbohydrate kinase [Aureimonas sp. AU12]
MAGPASTVHVVGNAGLDTTFRLVRLPAPGETLNADGGGQGLGGKGANQAVAASRTSARVTLHAALGSDAAAGTIRERLAAESLDLAGLVTAAGPSDSSAILVDAVGENAIATLNDRARGFDPLAGTGLTARLAPGDILLMQGNLPAGVTQACLAFARARGATTILNASPLDERETWRLDAVDWLVVNAGEAGTLTGADDPAVAAARLRALGAAQVIVSLGAGGALMVDTAGTRQFPAAPVTPLDTSGAGDVLCGVFTGLLARGHTSTRALRLAVTAAGIAVTRPGTLESCPSAAEIAALLLSEPKDPS